MQAIFWYDGRWYEDEQPKILGPMDHGVWMASVAFDGARSIGRLVPDLDRHAARLIVSARKMLLAPTVTSAAIEALAREAVVRMGDVDATYIRPMFFARRGFVIPEADSTDFCLTVYRLAMPEPTGMSVHFSTYRRPARDQAPTDAKSGCLYPNLQRALVAARDQGFDNAITLDPSGNVAELATANLWIAKDGVALTPVCNGTFLDGITRQRVFHLLRGAGIEAIETTLTREDIIAADEVFSTGNYGKVMPITRVGERRYQPGPIYQRARQLYFDFAATQPVD